MAIYTADSETGTFIDRCESIEEARSLIEKYEAADDAAGVYEENFYDIVNEDHKSII